MAKIKIGYHRFYNANACAHEGIEPIRANFKFDKFDILLHAGEDFLKYPIYSTTFGTPENIDGTPSKPSRRPIQTVPSSDVFPADFYVELLLTQDIEVEDELAEAFENDDLTARDKIFAILNYRKEDFAAALDYVAGLLGLRLNKLLVCSIIHEQQYIYYSTAKKGMAFQSSVKITFTDSFKFDKGDDWAKAIKTTNNHLSKDRWIAPAGALVWLLRAWATDDIVLKFFSFLTALESVVPKPIVKSSEEEKAKKKLLALVESAASVDDKAMMIKIAKSISTAPPLAICFERWAKRSALATWENDVKTFKRFNRLRNIVFHTGKPGMEHQVEKELKDISALEDLAERYVSLALFGDANVYKSSHRSQAKISA